MNILATSRLTLHALTLEDAPFILRLVNEPSWLEFIGDKHVKTIADAERYLTLVPLALYAKHGFGLYRVDVKETGLPAGMCGLIQRDTLPGADLGFAFLPEYCGHGFAREAADAVAGLAHTKFGLGRLLAITTAANVRSVHLLESIGFRFESLIPPTATEPELKLFARELP